MFVYHTRVLSSTTTSCPNSDSEVLGHAAWRWKWSFKECGMYCMKSCTGSKRDKSLSFVLCRGDVPRRVPSSSLDLLIRVTPKATHEVVETLQPNTTQRHKDWFCTTHFSMQSSAVCVKNRRAPVVYMSLLQWYHCFDGSLYSSGAQFCVAHPGAYV